MQVNNPDVKVLTETWLKSCILDNEVIPTDKYDVLRLDRTKSTHPPDQTTSKNFVRMDVVFLLVLEKI